METYSLLQQYWWLIISVLAAALVFLLLVQGGQSLLAAASAAHKDLITRSLGKKWELTFTTLVTFGGAFFASFPLFYSTSFGGAYWLWMLILFSFVVQAVSYEYRTKSGNVYGTRFYDTLLLVNGVAGPLLLGVAVAGMFFGAEFTVTHRNLLDPANPVISTWGPLHGLEAIACWKNLLFGAMILMLARSLGILYLICDNSGETDFVDWLRRQLTWNAALFVVLFLATAAVLLSSPGVQVADDGVAAWQPHLYFDNLLSRWWAALLLAGGVALVLWGLGKTVIDNAFARGIWYAGAGTMIVVLALFSLIGYGGTSYYPSTIDVQSSLTLANSSSSEFTLSVMSVVSLLVPFVVAYIAYCWRALDRK